MPQAQRTILVVEDEPSLQTVLADDLREAGYLVVVARAAEEAIAMLTAGARVDLVFCDVKLAGPMSGLGLAKWMRDWNRTIPIVLTSGDNEAVLPLDRQRVFPFLPKPFGSAQIVEAINRALSSG
jgi:CheY-like chemotaxis protein